MIVVDRPRPKKRVPALVGGEEVRVIGSTVTAHCPDCHTATPMLKPKRRVSNGIAITTGKCSVCRRETYRVGAARAADEGDVS